MTLLLDRRRLATANPHDQLFGLFTGAMGNMSGALVTGV